MLRLREDGAMVLLDSHEKERHATDQRNHSSFRLLSPAICLGRGDNRDPTHGFRTSGPGDRRRSGSDLWQRWIVKTDFGHSTDIAYAVARQADGKLVVAETTYSDNDYTGEDFALIRYNADGTVDRTFGSNGKVTTDFPGLAAVISAISRPRGGHLGDRDPT